MKFFSVVLLAALCATAVTAAPQTTQNFSFQEYGLSDIFEGIGKKLREHWANVKCISEVVGKAVQDSEVKSAWDETKTKIDTLANVEWKKCFEVTDAIERSKCKAVVVEKGVGAITEFLKKLAAEAKRRELVKEIKDKVVAECFKENAVFFDLDDQAEEFQASFPEQFECIVDVLGDVSKANGLGELWSKTEPQVRHRIGNWKQCPNAGNKFLVLLCNVKEGVSTYKLVTEYLQLAAGENPQALQEFARQIQQRCSGQTYAELMAEFAREGETDGNQGNGVEKVKCITEAIGDAVKETDFNKIWEEYKKDLEQLHERVKACKNLPSKWEAAKCVTKEVEQSREILHKFLANLKQANQETFERVKKYVKQRCFA
ncbi:uncharacterized protein LOC129571162 [Sitodiplosis mosellana]|uniref:uncharacterized protein LOC129571162 n=1 Tax=Sitodiplosis mosellana TaxID=263140 RepID=UPI0024440674|nr:uncharacterized protein LOC129571162 [Sitodiplosis mosellana]